MDKILELAKMIDHSILHPTFTDENLKKECEIAVKYNVATVCVKPYHTKQAAELIKGSDVKVCAVIGFPHGNSSVAIKVAETEQVIADGATEVDMVVNIGKTLQEDWAYVENELAEISKATKKHGAILKVIFETDFVTKDEQKIKLCELCSKYNIEFVKTSTGYGFVKTSDGKYNYTGANEHDIKLMRKHSSASVQVKASGGVRTLDELLKYKELGVSRIGATATEVMLEEAKKRFA